jgi:hypothetical protein
VQRGEQPGFMPFQRGGEFLELLAPKVRRTRRARLKKGALAMNAVRKIHK